MNLPIKEYLPCKSLSAFVELYWEGSFNSNSSELMSMQMIPNGCLELIIHLNDLHCDLEKNSIWAQSPDYMIIGLYTKPYEVKFQSHVKVFAMRLKPDGIYNLFGVPASALIESFEDMSLILGIEFRDFCHRIKEEKSVPNMIAIAENYLLKSLQKNRIDKSYVNLAAELIRNTSGIRIEDISNLVFISQRQLEREFKNKVGISPKHYLRITRINEIISFLNAHPVTNLVSVAYHFGYFDQAHFINDFKRITGKIPSMFTKTKAQIIGNEGLSRYQH
jgi:AraC-like DNA-binding protein